MEDVIINDISKAQGLLLPGQLRVSSPSLGIVIFVHGSGSSRLSPRNQEVAGYLNKQGISTLLFDLLTEEESLNRENTFNIQLLARRLKMATRWVQAQRQLELLPIAYFGASTGAAAALVTAAELNKDICAIVSRGGRPDLALSSLSRVNAPTLLLVGGDDDHVITLNEQAATHLKHSKIEIINGASHLFEEPGMLEQVCKLAAKWFAKYLKKRPHGR